MSRCRECNHRLGAVAPDPRNTLPMPTAGAVAICVYCGCLSIFTGRGFETREPTRAEAADLEADEAVVEAQAAARLYADEA